MVGRLYIILSSSNEEDETRVKTKLKELAPMLSIGPSRYSTFSTGVEFYATANLKEDEAEDMLYKLSDYYQGSLDSCTCYSFNANIFDEAVEQMQFDLFD